MDLNILVVSILCCLGVLVSSIAGLAGGVIVLPITLFILRSSSAVAVGLKSVCVFGGAVVNMRQNTQKTHPLDPRRPLIDWAFIIAMTPSSLLGARLGGLLNKKLPPHFTLPILTILLAYVAYETKAKADKLNPHKKQKAHGKSSPSAEPPGGRAAAPAAHRVATSDLEAPLIPDDASDAESKPYDNLEGRMGDSLAGALTIDGAAACDPVPEERAAPASDSSSRGRTLPLYAPPSAAHPPGTQGFSLPSGSPTRRDVTGSRDPESDMASPLGSSPMDSQYWRLRPKVPLLRLDMLVSHSIAAEASAEGERGCNAATCGRDGCGDGDHECYSLAHSSDGSLGSASVADPAGPPQPPPAEEQVLGFLWKEVAAICLLFACMLAIDVGKTGVQCGSRAFWALELSAIPIVLGTMLWSYRSLIARGKEQLARERLEGEIHWSNATARDIPLMFVGVGIMTGALGIGGGLIQAPIMLKLNVRPDVARVTNLTMVFFSSGVSASVYMSMGDISPSLALLFFLVGWAGTEVAHLIMTHWRALRDPSRQYRIVYLMAALILVGALLTCVRALIAADAVTDKEVALLEMGHICKTSR